MKRAILEILPGWLLVILFGLIVFHAPLTVVVGSHWPELALGVKAWKELVMIVVAVLVIWQYRTKITIIVRDVVVGVSLVYITLHLVTVMMAHSVTQSIVAGLMIDLRYIAYFLLVYLYLKLYPSYRRVFLKAGAIGAIVVVGFTLAQTVLPRDFLAHFGYGDTTIKPYLLLDENPAFVRYGSTLRGPNPLGAYALIVATICVTYLTTNYRRIDINRRLIYGGGAAAACVAAWVSYSRSAWLGIVIAFGVIVVSQINHWLTKRQMMIGLVLTVVLCVAMAILLQSTTFYKNVILHDNPTTGAATTSDQGHATSLIEGTGAMLKQPFGGGIGSSGSASLLSNKPLIIENQFLMIAHEVGWLGLGLFIALWVMILRRLWSLRQYDWLALAVYSSGIGLTIVALLWPVFTDDTVSLIWWGLAAIALATITRKKEVTHGTTHKKAKRTA